MCDDDAFGSLEDYTMCVTMVGLRLRKFGGSLVVCDDDKCGGFEVYTLCVMAIGL